ncbi:pyridoxal phosphate-dependent aminotransferase [Micromonospora sp. DT233]|uniref:pyridoxal phosphate-dependent aminotransferase n=1 Tax=Micromonospora sp. DT233 TaxID=3393432 RepID=UPI003CE8C448
MQLFAPVPRQRSAVVPDEAHAAARRARAAVPSDGRLLPVVDERVLDVFARAKDPGDPMELRDLWLGRVEHELGAASHRPWLADRWRSAAPRQQLTPEEVLGSRATVRFVKELFNWYFRDDLYGDLAAPDTVLLSSGSVDEQEWGLPESLKDCLRFALDQDWYGYSDSRGRVPAREAVAAYENERIEGSPYTVDEIALTMGGTFAVSSLADFILHGGGATDQPVLCGIPNYPPLVESVARRRPVRLVPLPSADGRMSLEPLIAALTPATPLVLIQTVGNPTGAAVDEEELGRLIEAAGPGTMILLDECHEWLGPVRRAGARRAAPNVIRVSSLSKAWSAPGLKVGWITADAGFIADYYEYASTTFGGPPSFLYTLVEVLARMERWLLCGREEVGPAELAEFEATYPMDAGLLNATYVAYRADRINRERGLSTLRDGATAVFSEAAAIVHPAHYSINLAIEFPGWDDSYRCFRDLLRDTGVSVFPGILTFCLSGGVGRVTTARRWSDLAGAAERVGRRLAAGPAS